MVCVEALPYYNGRRRDGKIKPKKGFEPLTPALRKPAGRDSFSLQTIDFTAGYRAEPGVAIVLAPTHLVSLKRRP
jgi:hypothetical protein